MSEKIVNIYSFTTEKGTDAYIYSTEKTTDKLGFNYYILTKNKDDTPVIYEPINTISLLQNNEIKLKPITRKDSEEYKKFLSELLIAIQNNEEKEAVPSRR